MQQEMLQVQQESINDPKKMIAFFLKKPKKKPKSSRPGASSSKPFKSKAKEKVGESSTSENTDGESNFKYEIPKSSSKSKRIQNTKIVTSRGWMSLKNA